MGKGRCECTRKLCACLRSSRVASHGHPRLDVALTEHGHLDPAEEVMTETFDDLRGAGVATRTACTLTGRARASPLPSAAPVRSGHSRSTWCPGSSPPMNGTSSIVASSSG
jgi:hypothetical protein